MAKCQQCGKGPVAGKNVSHAQNRTPRVFAPNIQKAVVMVDGKAKSMRLCTRCIRTHAKTA
jgi:large subunit ribosomal protein L28